MNLFQKRYIKRFVLIFILTVIIIYLAIHNIIDIKNSSEIILTPYKTKKAIDINTTINSIIRHKVDSIVKLQDDSCSKLRATIQTKQVELQPIRNENLYKDDTLLTKTDETATTIDSTTNDTVSTATRSIETVDTTSTSTIDKYAIKRDYIEALIETINKNRTYPKSAKKLKQHGTVVLNFYIDSNGTFNNIKISEDCQYSTLNKSAIKTVESIKAFKPIPKEIDEKKLYIELPIAYNLTEK